MITEKIIVSGPRYGASALRNDERNKQILLNDLNAFKSDKARVGDYLRLPNGKYTRFTHDWKDSIQTGGGPGPAYYLGEGYMSYSGGLNPGIEHQFLEKTMKCYPAIFGFFPAIIQVRIVAYIIL